MSTKNLIRNGNFEAGNTSFTSEYQYVDEKPGACQYTIDVNAKPHNNDWIGVGHRGSGKFMIVNGCTDTPIKKIWSQAVGLEPLHTYEFVAYACNLYTSNDPYPKLQLSIDDENCGPPLVLRNGGSNHWEELRYEFTAEPGQQKVVLSLRTTSTEHWGNDLGIDNISLVEMRIRPLP